MVWIPLAVKHSQKQATRLCSQVIFSILWVNFEVFLLQFCLILYPKRIFEVEFLILHQVQGKKNL